VSQKVRVKAPASWVSDVTYQDLPRRALDVATCEKYRYGVATYKGKPVQVARYYRDGREVAQKLRFKDKSFVMLVARGEDGERVKVPLYGQHLWNDGKHLVITEGEIDALSMAQVQGLKWPVVSVPNGAQGAAKTIAQEIEWVERFERVVFMFDMDEPGREAAEECARLLPPGRAAIAQLPRKDPNEMLVAGEAKQMLDAMWRAQEYRPDGMLTIADLEEDILRGPDEGLPWPWESLTAATYGRRLGEIYMLGAGTGVGKTDVFTQVMDHTLALGHPIAVFSMEQDPRETVKRIAGKRAGRVFHLPDDSWSQEELQAAVAELKRGPPVHLYDSWGSTDWNAVKARITYYAHAAGVQHFFVDHLTALASAEDDERRALERIMADVAMLAKRLHVAVYMISHLATPEGKPHEEGGRVMIRHFKGSRAIGYWAHFMFALERNQQANDEVERRTTTFRVLKDRYTGRSTGRTFELWYDEATGVLTEDVPQAGFDSGDDAEEEF